METKSCSYIELKSLKLEDKNQVDRNDSCESQEGSDDKNRSYAEINLRIPPPQQQAHLYGELRETSFCLLLIFADWLTDLVMGSWHISVGNPKQGIYTFAIVLIAGLVNIGYIFTKNSESMRKEIYGLKWYWKGLFFTPSLTPIVSVTLRLTYLVKMIRTNFSNQEENKYVIRKVFALESMVRESFYEGLPQAVLQTIILLEASGEVALWHGIFSGCAIFVSTFGFSTAIHRLQTFQSDPDPSKPHIKKAYLNRLDALCFTGLQLLTISCFAVTFREIYKENLLSTAIIVCVILFSVFSTPLQAWLLASKFKVLNYMAIFLFVVYACLPPGIFGAWIYFDQNSTSTVVGISFVVTFSVLIFSLICKLSFIMLVRKSCDFRTHGSYIHRI